MMIAYALDFPCMNVTVTLKTRIKFDEFTCLKYPGALSSSGPAILTKPDFYNLLQMQQMLPAAVALARALRQMTTLRHCPFAPLCSRRLRVHTSPASLIRPPQCSAPLPAPLSSPGFHILDSCLVAGSGSANR